MKNKAAVIIALCMGIICCAPDVKAKADTGDISAGTDSKCFADGGKKDGDSDELTSDIGRLPDINQEEQPVKTEDKDEKERLPGLEKENAGFSQLQIPDRLEVIIDPWEMDGHGQIYSEEYRIRNVGNRSGILTLSNIACTPQKQSKVVIKSDTAGIHNNEEKSVYMQMVFGNGDQIVLSQERASYQVELQAGEELTVHFQGEVNEYAAEKWGDGDLAVRVVYSWEMADSASDMESEENREDYSDVDSDIEEETGKDVDFIEWESLPENIALGNPERLEFMVDSWEMNENDEICSKWYTIQNEGECAGTFTLSEFLCEMGKDNEKIVCADEEEWENDENCSIYIRLFSEDGEEITSLQNISPDGQKKFEYEMELEPEERLTYRIVCRVKDMGLDEWIETGTVITGKYSWDFKEMMPE